MTNKVTINQNMIHWRKKAGLTKNELADRLHVSRQAISQWERGETLPDILTLPAIAAVFGISVDTLLGVKEEPTETISSGLCRHDHQKWNCAPGDPSLATK